MLSVIDRLRDFSVVVDKATLSPCRLLTMKYETLV